MLKFRRTKGMYIITYEGREFIFPTLHDALEYIFYRRAMALPGQITTYHNDTMYPVNSLLPPVVKRAAYFYDLGAEII
jgi:hypothetical protein